MPEKRSEGVLRLLDRNPPEFTEMDARQIALELYGKQGDFSPLESERDVNYRIRTDGGGDFVLKLANAADDPGEIDFQVSALQHIAQQDPGLRIPRLVPTTKGQILGTIEGPDGAQHTVHMLTYLPGMTMAEIPQSPALWRSLGETLARLDLALRGLFHPHARRVIPWDITRCADLRPHTAHITDPTARKHARMILDRATEEILPQLGGLRHQVIHGDANPVNILIDPEHPDQAAGFIDFGDSVFAPLITELPISSVENILLDHDLESLCALVAGYDRVLPLEEQEIDLLYDLILARRAMAAAIIAWRQAMTPNQPAYLVEREKPTWDAMANLLALGRNAVSGRLRSACRFPAYVPAGLEERVPSDDLLARRKEVLGSHLSLFYSKPLHFERGRGPWLYDARGKPYLDAYNNVPVTGHCHPRVVRAIERQAAALNTNTRYLYRVIVEYAERLISLFPEQLSVCVFVNSGSEAVDIAWRMARFLTGAAGALVMEHAYHGITQATADLSPSEWAGSAPAHIERLATPDALRAPRNIEQDSLAGHFAADADRAIADLAERGLKPAAYVVDTIFSSSGIPDVPSGYLASVASKVRSAGGLFIADEVQAGFGRCGGDMWGYLAHGVEPDIVTLGKPIGGGFPLGAIVTRREILEPLASQTDVFSTFGGNPVACAAGMAVLDVIEDEGLLANSQETGDYLLQGLRGLMERHAWIGDVRGRGLMVAVELERERAGLEPAEEAAARVLEWMREEGVLIGRTGPLKNVLKIRPPLVFKQDHADILIGALDRSLAKL